MKANGKALHKCLTYYLYLIFQNQASFRPPQHLCEMGPPGCMTSKNSRAFPDWKEAALG